MASGFDKTEDAYVRKIGRLRSKLRRRDRELSAALSDVAALEERCAEMRALLQEWRATMRYGLATYKGVTHRKEWEENDALVARIDAALAAHSPDTASEGADDAD